MRSGQQLGSGIQRLNLTVMDISLILKQGLIYSLLLSVSLFLMILVSPRLMLQDYPKEIQRLVPPKTKKEKLGTFTYGLPFLLTFIFYPLLLGLYYAIQYQLKFQDIMLFVWGLMMFFNVWDMIVIDWLVVCVITPKFLIVPGTEGNKGYKNYLFDFIAFLKGTLITFALSLIISVVIKYLLM